jgi:hypothetical protein
MQRDTSKLLADGIGDGPLLLAPGKNLDGLAAMGTVQETHVLDHPQDRHALLTE